MKLREKNLQPAGLEPATTGYLDQRANQLRHGCDRNRSEINHFESLRNRTPPSKDPSSNPVWNQVFLSPTNYNWIDLSLQIHFVYAV